MGMFDQLKMATDMMKGMSPDQMKELLNQAKASKQMFAEEIKKGIEEAIQTRGLVSREEVERMIRERLK